MSFLSKLRDFFRLSPKDPAPAPEPAVAPTYEQRVTGQVQITGEEPFPSEAQQLKDRK